MSRNSKSARNKARQAQVTATHKAGQRAGKLIEWDNKYEGLSQKRRMFNAIMSK